MEHSAIFLTCIKLPHDFKTFVLFVVVFLGFNQYWSGGFMVFVVLSPGAPKGSPAVVLVLKRLRRRDHSLYLMRQTGRSRAKTFVLSIFDWLLKTGFIIFTFI